MTGGRIETDGVPCMLMRGGTSKGAYFLATDLPADPIARDDLLLRIMGSPDPRQIDGIGGAHPLTSKVAIVAPSPDTGADVDYLFLQVAVDRALVSADQACGNILAGVGPFAIERGLVPTTGERTAVRIRMVNTGGIATASVPTPGGRVDYRGGTAIGGVPRPAATVSLAFAGTEGSSCGSLLPTGQVRELIDGSPVTLLDNGMPVAVVAAADLGVAGDEEPAVLEADRRVRDLVETIRLEAGRRMGLGDVRAATVPKVSICSAPRRGGTLTTRTFIPHRCHTAIGVLGAVTVATAVELPGTVAAALAGPRQPTGSVRVEHPTGSIDVLVELRGRPDGWHVERSELIRTARKLFDGIVHPWLP
jgi:4-oxalomesaconate tautomerase